MLRKLFTKIRNFDFLHTVFPRIVFTETILLKWRKFKLIPNKLNFCCGNYSTISLSTPTFSLYTPVDNSETTWKKGTKCKKRTQKCNIWPITKNIKQIFQSSLTVLHEFLKKVLEDILWKCSMRIHRIFNLLCLEKEKKKKKKVQE